MDEIAGVDARGKTLLRTPGYAGIAANPVESQRFSGGYSHRIVLMRNGCRFLEIAIDRSPGERCPGESHMSS
jgi:hypothetical protein